MPGHKTLIAFPADGSIVRDTKAYVKNDFLVSDNQGWLAPPLRPTRAYGWTKEGSPPRLLGNEYILTTAPSSPEHNAPLIQELAKVWEEASAGKRMKPGKISDTVKLQLTVAVLGIAAFLLVITVWLVLSQTYDIPPTPATNTIQETEVEPVTP